MSEEQNKQINIFLNSEEKKEQVFNNATSYEKYIILQNETFQIKNKELEQNISRLETINEELEEDNSRMETGKRYTKNLLKNFAELDKLRVQVNEETNSYYKNIKENKDLFKKKLYKHIRICQFFLVIISSLIFCDDEYNIQMFVNLTVSSCIICFLESMMINCNHQLGIKLVTHKDLIKNLNKEIKEITDSHDFINEHIDNL